MTRRTGAKKVSNVPLGWNTTDEDEITRRKERAKTEKFQITLPKLKAQVFGTMRVSSESGSVYNVEVISHNPIVATCSCKDFLISGLHTCKHIEAVILQLSENRSRALSKARKDQTTSGLLITFDFSAQRARVLPNRSLLPRSLRPYFNHENYLIRLNLESLVERLSKKTKTKIHLSPQFMYALDKSKQVKKDTLLRRRFEKTYNATTQKIQKQRVVNMPLYPYQREGMMHLAFQRRALLADEMGLGKTVQAIAACSLLYAFGQIRNVLVVAPASLKAEWEEQIKKFTNFKVKIAYGNPQLRAELYENPELFTLVNYEQVVRDVDVINQVLQPCVVVLDEAQRIKNWETKTARTIKNLNSQYAFVLTGTPIENRIDELYSIINFLEPTLLGPLFRFNRDYYQFDEKGRPSNFKNLQQLHERIKPLMLRRLKSQVEKQLPAREDRTIFVPMSETQQVLYNEASVPVSQLMKLAEKRPLKKEEFQRLMIFLGKMRMLCDTPFILDRETEICPKLDEMMPILESFLSNPDVKVIIFSEWVRMLDLIIIKLKKSKIDYAVHTGSVSQKKRRTEIIKFKNDPNCRIFLSSDSGGLGLNLQNASVVINCDLPWNPAKLEQRIARAWRKHQKRSVSVINFVSEETLEHGMMHTLANKQKLASGVLDLKGDLNEIELRGNRSAFLERLNQVMKPIQDVRRFDDPAKAVVQAVLSQEPEKLKLAVEIPSKNGGKTLLTVLDAQENISHSSNAAELASLNQGLAQSLKDKKVQLQTLDPQTWDLLEHLESLGVLTLNHKAGRDLNKTLSKQDIQRYEALQKQCINQANSEIALATHLLNGKFVDAAMPVLENIIVQYLRSMLFARYRDAPETKAILLESQWHSETMDCNQVLATWLCKPTKKDVVHVHRELDRVLNQCD